MKEVFPKVSILIPARDEAQNLPRLFASLSALSYPIEKLEILLGNDDSKDDTGILMNEFAKSNPCVTVIHLEENLGQNLKGKARVLDRLANLATGEYLFFTDADIALPCHWVEGMLSEFSENVGVVVGVTGFYPKNIWFALQGIEWFMALSIFKIVADLNFATTGLGNNMAVTREAYYKVGGYKTIGFSIVEDYLLYRKIIEAGYKFKHAFKSTIVAYTEPPENYFKQRKRWISGAVGHSAAAIIVGFLQALSFPILLVMFFLNWQLASMLFVVLLLIYFFLILFFEQKLKLTGYLKYLPLFSMYISVGWFLQLIYFLFGSKVSWKGRDYQ